MTGTIGALPAVPVPGGIAPTSGTVRLSLTDAAHSETFGVLGSQVASVDGEVRAINDSSVTIAVSEVARTSADDDRFHGEATVIPSRYIRSIERKRIQVARSLLIAGTRHQAGRDERDLLNRR